MRQLALVAVATALVFAAGALTGRWYESRRPLPPPPGPFMGEFGGHRIGLGRSASPPISRAEFVAEVERLRPQIEAFRKSMDEIENEFERSLDVILTPGQRVLNAERLKRHAQSRSANDNRPLDDEHLMRLVQLPNMALLRDVTLQMGYEYLNRDLKFDESQHDAVFSLLRIRRDRVLAFIDRNPPPSLRLVPLAPYAQRLAPSTPPAPETRPDSPAQP